MKLGIYGFIGRAGYEEFADRQEFDRNLGYDAGM